MYNICTSFSFYGLSIFPKEILLGPGGGGSARKKHRRQPKRTENNYFHEPVTLPNHKGVGVHRHNSYRRDIVCVSSIFLQSVRELLFQ